MFTTLTWAGYFYWAGLLTLAWYAYVALRYYPREIRGFFKQRKAVPPGTEGADPVQANFFIGDVPESLPGEGAPLADNLYQEVDDLIGRVRAICSAQTGLKAAKRELTEYLRLLLAEYPRVKDSQFRSQINEYIATASNGPHGLDETEADRLW